MARVNSGRILRPAPFDGRSPSAGHLSWWPWTSDRRWAGRARRASPCWPPVWAGGSADARRRRGDGRRRAGRRALAQRPRGARPLLAVLPGAAFVVGADDTVLRASAAGGGLGPRPGRRASTSRRSRARDERVRRDGAIREQELELRRPPLGKGVLEAARPRRPAGTAAASCWSTTSPRRAASTPCAATSSPTSATSSRRRSARCRCSPRRCWPPATTPRPVRRFADRMQVESQRLTNLVNDLIDLSRLQGDDPLKHAEVVDVDRVVPRRVDDDQAARGRPRDRASSSASPCGAQVLGDEGQLVTALRNLLDQRDRLLARRAPGSPSAARCAGRRGRDRRHRPGHRHPRDDRTASSSGSTASTRRARASPAAPASAWPSSSTSAPTTAASAPSGRWRARAPRSPCGCRPASSRPIATSRAPSQQRVDPVTRSPGRRGRGVLLRRPGLHAAQGGLRGRRRRRPAPTPSTPVRAARRRPRAARPHAARHVRHRGVPQTCGQRSRCRSSWSPRRTARSTRSSGSSSAPTTTSPSRSPRASCVARIRAVLRRSGEPEELLPGDDRGGPGAHGRRAARRDRRRRAGRAAAQGVRPARVAVRNAGRVLTRGQLIDRVWGADYVGDTKTLDVHVKRLRAKIEADPAEPGAPGHGARPGLQVRGLTGRSRGRRRRPRRAAAVASSGVMPA